MTDWSLGAGLAGKGVVVTGAARGIGRATAEAFAAVGARVCAVDQRAAAVEQLVDSLGPVDTSRCRSTSPRRTGTTRS